MKKILNGVLAMLIIASLTACMIVPPRAEYVGPRIGVVAPYPIYQQPYDGDHWRHSRHYRESDGRW